MDGWNKFSEKKPQIGIEILAYCVQWIHPDFNPKGIRVGFLNQSEQGEFVSAKYCTQGDCYESDEQFLPEYWKNI